MIRRVPSVACHMMRLSSSSLAVSSASIAHNTKTIIPIASHIIRQFSSNVNTSSNTATNDNNNSINEPTSDSNSGNRYNNRHKNMKIDEFLVTAKRDNIPMSPLKMKFLMTLIHNTWLPDALAQLKFTPKHRGVDVAKVVQNAYNMARVNYGAIPEELMVKEAFINKGLQQKRPRIMGRGRTGVGYKRASHVTVKVTKVDFDKEIRCAPSVAKKSEWKRRLAVVNRLKNQVNANDSSDVDDSSSDGKAK